MKRKTVVSIYDMDFTFVGEESEEYVQKIAALVEHRMREVTEGSKISTLNAAILTAANIADDYYKALQLVEDSKVQVRSYFEEISKLKDENDRLRRASRGGSGGTSRRSRRSITENTPLVAIADAAPAPSPAMPAAEAAETAAESEEAAKTAEGAAEPVEIAEEPAEAVADEPEECEIPFDPEPEVLLVMDSEIEAAESEPVEPSQEEAEQLQFDK
ncbi:MAG: cell division protein ZapA [Oscillospiraceae bacterium]|nr:cell division protein ZapA [Oscillospiraceae bacterium]